MFCLFYNSGLLVKIKVRLDDYANEWTLILQNN